MRLRYMQTKQIQVVPQHNDTIWGLQDSEVNHSDLQGRVCRNKTILAEKHYILDLVNGYTKSEAYSSPTECFSGTLAKTDLSQYHGCLHLSLSGPTGEHTPSTRHHSVRGGF